MPRLRRPTIRDRSSFFTGLAFVAIGVGGLVLGAHDTAVAWIFTGGGALRVVASFFFRWRSPTPETAGAGPGSLAPTPAHRFRATGWPPSKDPDDYR